MALPWCGPLPRPRRSTPRRSTLRAAGSPLALPMLDAEMMQATASAMSEAMAQVMRPWLVGLPVTPPPVQRWSGPGVHVNYTHLEMRWPIP